MEEIILTQDDPRLGTLDNGVPTYWPATDIDGNAYDRMNATVLCLNTARFVVFSPGRGRDLVIILRESGHAESPFATDDPVDPPFAVDKGTVG